MKLFHALHRLSLRLPPQTWRETYAAIFALVAILLIIATAADFFKAALP